ncbi:MAG: isochorismate synthase [Pseudomonadota bacterium]
MKVPAKCKDLNDVRAEIDRIDSQLIAALGSRLEYVKAASAFKADEKSIPAPERVAAMLPQRRIWATKAGLDPNFIEKIFRDIIAWFINEQILYYRSKAHGRHGLSIDHSKLFQMLAAGQARAKSLGRAVLVSLSQRIEHIDSIRMFDAARDSARPTFLWGQENPEFAIVGVDAAHVLEAGGRERFPQVIAAWRSLLDAALIERPEGVQGVGPILSGGFSFDPDRPKTPPWNRYADASLILPKLQLTNTVDGSYLTLNVVVKAEQAPTVDAEQLKQLWLHLLGHVALDADAEPATDQLLYRDALPAGQWKQLVQDAATKIRGGSLQKVVLAREVRAASGQPFAVRRSLERLRKLYPRAYLFAISRGESCFFGATPERLVRLNANRVEVTALAGTCRRGATESEDQILGEQLLRSAKDQHEHALVVQMLRDSLHAFCDSLDPPAQAALLKLPNVQHLYTPLAGHLRSETNLLELVAALHPTPAVGGLPRASALAYLRTREQLDRGWFAAPVGWVDAQGQGEFAVALRSALVAGHEASLFAGCGIVADSEPESEFAETEHKLRAMMFALGQDERQPR